ELAIAGRVNFHKVYDLAARVLPAADATPAPSEAEHLDWACRSALERLGVATPDEIAGFWRAVSLQEARAWCELAAARGEIVPVLVESTDGSRPRASWALPDWRERAAALSAAPRRVALLSPSHPTPPARRRPLRLFDLDYRFEAFVPDEHRQHGYYVLPI